MVKDKTFWFVAYEGFREKRGATREVQVETPELRNYLAANFPNSVANYLFQHFPGPSTIVSGTGVSLAIQPSGASDIGIGVGQAINYNTTDQYMARVDHSFKESDKVFARWLGDYPRSSGASEVTTIGG